MESAGGTAMSAIPAIECRGAMGIAVTPVSRSFPRADPRARPRTCEARRSAGSAAGELPPRGGQEEYMKGPRPARMPVYGAGSKYLGRTQKETGWLRFHAPQPPAIPIAPPHPVGIAHSLRTVSYTHLR